MKVLIIEDEKIATENLISILKKVNSEIEIVGQFGNISDTVDWLNCGNKADLAYFDIQLNDGLSFEIFERSSVNCPVIFITSYDEHVMTSFDFNGIDYILKPLSIDKIIESLNKYEFLKNHFSGESKSTYISSFNGYIKSRLIVRKGNYFVSLDTKKIAYIQSENKISFIVTHDEIRYVSDYNLGEIENLLDKSMFFRANRQFIISVDSISRFKPYDKGKILLEVNPKSTFDITISQENASRFKSWIAG